MADFAVEPLGSVDVTALPGVGQFVRDALRDTLTLYACMPNWVETDVKAYDAIYLGYQQIFEQVAQAQAVAAHDWDIIMVCC